MGMMRHMLLLLEQAIPKKNLLVCDKLAIVTFPLQLLTMKQWNSLAHHHRQLVLLAHHHHHQVVLLDHHHHRRVAPLHLGHRLIPPRVILLRLLQTIIKKGNV